jgi:hypothetical protein
MGKVENFKKRRECTRDKDGFTYVTCNCLKWTAPGWWKNFKKNKNNKE